MIPTPLLACAAAASLIAAGTATGYALGNANVEPHTATVTEQVTAPPVTVRATETRTVRVSRDLVRTTAPSTPVRYYNPETGSSGIYQEYARRLVVAAEWPCLRRLWQNESGWNPRVVSPSGRHVGIPQLIGLKATDGWKHQVKRGLAYIDARYGGSPCRALAHYNAVRWY